MSWQSIGPTRANLLYSGIRDAAARLPPASMMATSISQSVHVAASREVVLSLSFTSVSHVSTQSTM